MASMDSESGVYAVEAIVDGRVRKGRRQYLVKWEGYSKIHNTWEDEENIFCKELIEEFEAQRAGAAARRRGRKPAGSAVPARRADSAPGPAPRVDHIASVARGPNNRILITLCFEDGHLETHENTVVHKLCPQQLIDYYESNINFGDEDSEERSTE